MSEHEYPECIEDDFDRQDEPEQPDDREQPEQEHCGRGICAAMEGHEGTCDEASGWAVEGEPEREALRGVLVNVLRNASNYPERVAPRILGQDMGPLIDRTTDAILAAGYRREPLAWAWHAGYEAGSADESFSARGLSSDPDAAEHPHTNPYAAVTPSTEETP